MANADIIFCFLPFGLCAIVYPLTILCIVSLYSPFTAYSLI